MALDATVQALCAILFLNRLILNLVDELSPPINRAVHNILLYANQTWEGPLISL